MGFEQTIGAAFLGFLILLGLFVWLSGRRSAKNEIRAENAENTIESIVRAKEAEKLSDEVSDAELPDYIAKRLREKIHK